MKIKIKSDYKPLLFLALAVGITSLVIAFFLKYLFPFVLGLILAVLIEPFIKFFEKKFNIKRSMLSLIILLIVFFIIGYLSVIIITQFTFELGKLIKTIPNYYHYFSNIIDKLSVYLLNFFTKTPADVLPYIKKNIHSILSTMTGILSTFYTSIMNRISMLPNLFMKIFILVILTFLFAYFISKDKDKIIYFIKKALPEPIHEKVKKVQLELFVSFIRLIKAQVTLVIISTLITITGFCIVGVDYALTLGIICGLLDLLPIVGPSLIFIPWIIFSIILRDISLAIALAIIYIIIIGSRQILQAKVIGQNLGINPLLSLISIYLGIQIFGIIGLFVGPIVVVFVRALMHSEIIPPLYKSEK